MNDLERGFRKNGFIHIPQALSIAEVKELRNELHRMFAQVDAAERKRRRRYLTPTEILADREIWKHTVSQRVTRPLKAILGDNYVMLPDLHVQRNMYGDWHTDSDGEVPGAYLRERAYRFVKCGIFLQDNTAQFGGGIEVVRGGHTFPLLTGTAHTDYFLRAWRNRFIAKFNTVTIPIKAGDFVAFDSRLPHSSTHPSKDMAPHLTRADTGTTDFEGDLAKYVLYWDASPNDRYARLFSENKKVRADVEEFNRKDATEVFFADYLRLTFPDSAPEFYRAAQEAGVGVFQLPEAEAAAINSRYQELASSIRGLA